MIYIVYLYCSGWLQKELSPNHIGNFTYEVLQYKIFYRLKRERKNERRRRSERKSSLSPDPTAVLSVGCPTLCPSKLELPCPTAGWLSGTFLSPVAAWALVLSLQVRGDTVAAWALILSLQMRGDAQWRPGPWSSVCR
jgi:hypothetical protein